MKFIRELEHLLFPVFIKCIADNDYRGLLLEGEADQMEQYIAWQMLLSKFHNEIGDKKVTSYVNRVSKMIALQLKIAQTYELHEAITTLHKNGISHIRPEYVERLANCLKEWGYNRKFTPATIVADLQYIANSISNDRLNLKIAKLEHEAIEKKEAESGAQLPPKKHWYKQLHAIEAHKKMTFDKSQLNMYDFALYLNELVEYNKEMQALNIKNARKNDTDK